MFSFQELGFPFQFPEPVYDSDMDDDRPILPGYNACRIEEVWETVILIILVDPDSIFCCTLVVAKIFFKSVIYISYFVFKQSCHFNSAI